MPFPSPLSGGQVTSIRAGYFSATSYILINPVNVVFTALVNQSVFSSTFATVTYDNSVGNIADVFDGFTVYIGSTSDIRNAEFVGRIRGNNSTGTVLNINETSSNIQENYYITVVKDVAGREKLGRYIERTQTVDWDITFRQLLPLVTGLQSAYAKKLSSGLATFTFPAVGLATTSGAAIASWSWDADGGSFVNGTVSTDAQPDIQYNTAGVYWPRVTVTDDGGRSNWFTMPVFVMSSDASDAWIVKGANALNITSSVGVGDEFTFDYFSSEMATYPSRSLITLWSEPNYNGAKTPIIDNICFVGRLSKETPKSSVNDTSGPLPDTSFTCEGFLAQLNRTRSPKLALSRSATPTDFGFIKTMTQWRIIVFVLSEFSTFTNICSLRFDDETDNYQNAEDSTEDTSLLSAINTLLSARISSLNISRQGEIYAAQNAVFMEDGDRNALDVIHTFTTSDMFSFSIDIDKVPTVGQIMLFGGGYTTYNNELRIIRAEAPAIASLEAQGIGSPITDILLPTDASFTAQSDEAERLVANALADANPKDTPTLSILDGYYFLSPTNFQWYKIIIATTDNNRNIVYTSADRFTLNSITISFDNDNGTWDISSFVLSKETRGSGAKTISQLEPGAIEPAMPILPTIPAYPGFPPLPDIFLPTGWTSANVPAIGSTDGAIVISPIPTTGLLETRTAQGNVVMCWDNEQVYLTQQLVETDVPPYNIVFTAESPMEVKDAKFDPFTRGAYVLVNDGAGNSELWRTADVFSSVPEWEINTTTLDDIDYTTIRTTSTPDRIYIFGIDDRTPDAVVTLLGGSGNKGLSGSSLISPHTGSVNQPGLYDALNDHYYQAAYLGGQGVSCNVQYTIPAGAILDNIYVRYQAQRSSTGFTTGEKTYEVSVNGVSYGNGTYITSNLVQTRTINVATPGLTGTVLFHNSMERSLSWCTITNITMNFTVTPINRPSLRLSTDGGDNFGSLKGAAIDVTSPGEPGYATGADDDYAYLGTDDIITDILDDTTVTTKTDSDSTGTFAKAIWAYGKNTERDIIFATDAAFGGQTMAIIEDDVASDITPNDGTYDGYIVGRNALCMSRVSDRHMWGIFTFDTDTNLAYTNNSGDTWTKSAIVLSSDATYIRVKSTNTRQVYLNDTGVIKYSPDGGVTVRNKSIPSATILGLEVR